MVLFFSFNFVESRKSRFVMFDGRWSDVVGDGDDLG